MLRKGCVERSGSARDGRCTFRRADGRSVQIRRQLGARVGINDPPEDAEAVASESEVVHRRK